MTTKSTSKNRAVAAGMLAVGLALGAAAPASAAGTTSTAPTTSAAAASTASSNALVKAWYFQFLGRSASADPGSRYWVDQLDRGVAPTEVLTRLVSTPEYVQAGVGVIYRAYLDRAPDAGARYWVDGVVEGRFPLEWVEQNVATSPEHSILQGPPSYVVADWYEKVLNRAPSGGENAYWVGRLNSGTSSLGVFRELWYTPEAVTRRVQGHYTQFLERGPALVSPGELAYWYGREVASDITVKVAIASSDQYRTRVGG